MFSVEFLTQSIALDWADVFWGYKNQLIGWRVPVDIAKANVDAGLPQNALEIQLAHMDKDHDWQVGILTRDLAQYNPIPEDVSKKKWLFLTLLFLYENKDKNNNNDLFDTLEEIYADFDYPSEISSFVPYMPPDDGYAPLLHTQSENCDRILRKWKEYLVSTKQDIFHDSSHHV